MSLFFKSTTKPELLQKFNLSGDLVKRRLQLLGSKLFKKCSLGEPISSKDLESRAMYLNRKFNIGFTSKDLVDGCELSKRPTESSDEIYNSTEAILELLMGLTDEELENLDLMSEIQGLPSDVLEYGVKPFYAENLKIVDGVLKDKSGEDLLEIKSEVDPEVIKQLLADLRRILPMSLYDFYEDWNKSWLNLIGPDRGLEDPMSRSVRTGTLAQITNHEMKNLYPHHTVEYYLKKFTPYINFSPKTLIQFYREMLFGVYEFMRTEYQRILPRTISGPIR